MARQDVTSQIKTMVIAGGDINDPALDHSGNQKLYNPLEHGDEVDLEHLAFSPIAINPTQTGSQQFPGVMPSGQLVYVLKNAGENFGIVLGQANSIRNGNEQSTAGGNGKDLMKGKVEELLKRDNGVSVPPQIIESEKRGAKIREIQEKGDKHSLSLLDGLPNHGALFSMSGFRLPDLKNVPTAKQHNDQMMTQNMFGQLQGAVSSLQSLMKGLKSNGKGGSSGANASGGGGLGGGQSYWQDIEDELSPNMVTAINSLSNLIQGHETDYGVGYVTGNVVHYGIYMENAVELLKNVQNIDDLMSVMSRLQWDTSIMGHEALDNVVVQIENAWGTALQEVDHNGTITVTYDNANAQIDFANSMANTNYASGASSAPASGGGSGGGSDGGGSGGGKGMGNIFGTASKTMQDMWKRLASTQEKEATKMHKKLTQEQQAQTEKQVNQNTQQGKDITTSLDFLQ